ncbi:MAG: helix-turn-helix domain-containing protein [bacterium]
MEKISIARRHRENKAQLFPVKIDPPRDPSQESANMAFQLPLLESLITEEANTIQRESKQFVVEITSGLNRPLKVTVSVQPLISGTLAREFFTVPEAARILHVSKKTLYRQLQKGNLAGLRVGKQWRVLLTP